MNSSILLASTTSNTAPKIASAQVDWHLWLFAPALGWAVLVLAVALVWMRSEQSFSTKRLLTPIEALSSSWSFSQSWAANLTAAATVVTGLFASSSILQGVVGTHSGRSLTAMLVAGALATGAAGAGTVITATFRSKKGTYAGAVIASALITMTGTGGQLLIVGWSASDLTIGNLNQLVWPLVIIAGCLLSAYGVSTLRQLLAEPNEALKVASVGAEYMDGKMLEKVEELGRVLTQGPSRIAGSERRMGRTAPGDGSEESGQPPEVAVGTSESPISIVLVVPPIRRTAAVL